MGLNSHSLNNEFKKMMNDSHSRHVLEPLSTFITIIERGYWHSHTMFLKFQFVKTQTCKFYYRKKCMTNFSSLKCNP
jgi:hypothetical protein